MIGFGSLGDPLLIARASAGVLSVLRQTFDGSPTVVVNVTAAGITAPVAIENAAGGGGVCAQLRSSAAASAPRCRGRCFNKHRDGGGGGNEGGVGRLWCLWEGVCGLCGCQGGGGILRTHRHADRHADGCAARHFLSCATVAPEASPTAVASASPPPPPASSTAPSVGPGWRFQLPYWTSRPRERARSGGEGHQEEARLPLSRRPSRCEGLSSCIKVKAGGGRGVYRANGVPKLCLSIANVSMTIHDHAFHKQVLPSSGMEFNVLFILFLTLLPAHARLSDVYRSSSHLAGRTQTKGVKYL